MGRTVAPFSGMLAYYVDGLRPWRRQMTPEDRAAFDALFEAAHFHMPSCVMMSALNPGEPILLAAVLELRKRLTTLQRRVAALEAER